MICDHLEGADNAEVGHLECSEEAEDKLGALGHTE